MTQVYNENELYHYGVKGMKWGVRKSLRGNFGSDKRLGRELTRNAHYARDEYRAAIKKTKKYNTGENRAKERKWKEQYKTEETMLKNHVNKMVKKYGNDRVKDIKYKDIKVGKNRVERMIKGGSLSDEALNANWIGTFLGGPIVGSVATGAVEAYKRNEYKKKVENRH